MSELIVSFEEREGEEVEEYCGVCLDECIQHVSCCGSPLHEHCALNWAEESNRCPFCNRSIHEGEDRRHLNHEVHAQEEESEEDEMRGDTISSSVLYKIISEYLKGRVELIDKTLDTLRQLVENNPEHHFLTDRPLLFPVISGGDYAPMKFLFEFDHDENMIEMSENTCNNIVQVIQANATNESVSSAEKMLSIDLRLKCHPYLLLLFTMTISVSTATFIASYAFF